MQRTASPAWTLSDGHAGNVRQAQALARALGLVETRDITLESHAPWRWLAPRRTPFDTHAFGPGFPSMLQAPPQLAIGCGRQAALATRMLRGRDVDGVTRTRVIQILDPRIDPAHWDLVVAPEHDGLTGDNVITLLGSLHPVDDAWLAAGRTEFAYLAALPSPRIALLIGGPSAHWQVDASQMQNWFSEVADAARASGGSVLATTSRRTPQAVADVLHHALHDVPHIAWTSTADGPNPYAGLLAHADRIVCTSDSVNMLSEACATRAPVCVLGIDRLLGRPRHFVDALLQRHRVTRFEPGPLPFAHGVEIEPLRETPRIAALIRSRLESNA